MFVIIVVLYVLAAFAPIAGLLLAWLAARNVWKQSREQVEMLERIETKYEALRHELPLSQQWAGPAAEELSGRREEEDNQVGRIRFTYGQMDRAPHHVTEMILRRLASRFPIEIVLIVAGLLAGAAASILSLWL